MNEWDKFIKEHRAEMDEFLGPNNPTYTAILLKGQIAKRFKYKERTLDYFEALMRTGLKQTEQNVFLRALLMELRNNPRSPPDTLMRFGVRPQFLLGRDRNEYMDIMEAEFRNCKGCDHYYEECYDVVGLCHIHNKYTSEGYKCQD